jgi:hypothetical protein
MTIQIELDADTEARLKAQAVRRGIAPEQYAAEFLRNNLPFYGSIAGPKKLTSEGLRALTEELQRGSENLPTLPPEAFERESFYEDDRIKYS